MKSHRAEFARRGVTVVVISFAPAAKIAEYQKYHNWPFAILADPRRIAYQAFALERLSLFRVFSWSTLRLYLRLLREGMRIRNYGRDDYYQAGGDFLIDRDGNILFAHRSTDPSDRPAVTRLIDVIDEAIGRQ